MCHGSGPRKGKKDQKKKNVFSGVGIMAQWLTNPTSIHEDAGSILGLAQWVKDPALLWLWWRPAAVAPIGPLAWEPAHARGMALKRQKTNKKRSQSVHSTQSLSMTDCVAGTVRVTSSPPHSPESPSACHQPSRERGGQDTATPSPHARWPARASPSPRGFRLWVLGLCLAPPPKCTLRTCM